MDAVDALWECENANALGADTRPPQDIPAAFHAGNELSELLDRLEKSLGPSGLADLLVKQLKTPLSQQTDELGLALTKFYYLAPDHFHKRMQTRIQRLRGAA